jgi:DNA invertase Pin-like site-specific DNA recombinase
VDEDKAGIWLRVSTLDQSEEGQYPDCAAYRDRKGYAEGPTYEIHGASARKGNRRFDRAWADVLDDIRHGKITVLIVWRLSRLDRKLAALAMIKEVTDLGARVEFAQQPHLNDLSTMGGRISLKVEEEIAFAESEEKSQREKASIALRRSQGKNTGRYPWGLASDEGKLYVTEHGREWVTFVFEQVLSGRTPGEVAAMLRARGVVPSCHSLWVRRMIMNERYRGLVIDPPTWDAANDSLAAMPTRGRSPRTGERPLITPECAGCSGPMWPHTSRAEKRYYRCFSAQGNGTRGCGARLVPLGEADEIITEMFTDDAPHTEWKYVPGDDIDRQVREVRDKGAAAMKSGKYQDAMELMTEAERLESQPRREAGWREVPTGITRKQWWASASQDDRRALLATYVFSISRGDDDSVTVTVRPRRR